MATTKIGKQTYISWYRDMLLIRRFEEKAGQMYGMQKIRGFCHLYIGQEAVAVGSVAALEKNDIILTAYRDHGLALARGTSPNAAMAELYGKITGCTKGKGGSMHFFDVENNFYGGHAIVGAQIPLGAGIAFAEKYKGTSNICACFFGDGAVRQGALHESFNLAAAWNLPVLYIIENNGYAMGTSVKRSGPDVDMYKLGLHYDITSEQVDGMNVETVYKAVKKAASRIRKTSKPYLLEICTYRYKGHSMSDPAKYRSKEEVEAYKKKDPIQQALKKITENGWLDEEGVKKIQAEVKKTVEESVRFAEESPFPDVDEVYTDVYVQEDYPFIKD